MKEPRVKLNVEIVEEDGILSIKFDKNALLNASFTDLFTGRHGLGPQERGFQ